MIRFIHLYFRISLRIIYLDNYTRYYYFILNIFTFKYFFQNKCSSLSFKTFPQFSNVANNNYSSYSLTMNYSNLKTKLKNHYIIAFCRKIHDVEVGSITFIETVMTVKLEFSRRQNIFTSIC